MATTTNKKLTFADFLVYSPDGGGKFELVDGEILQVEPTRAHKNVARFLVKTFDREAERLRLNYIVDKDIVIRTIKANGQEQGRNPDVGVVKAAVWNSNALTYGALTEPIQLAVEVVSTNWEDDYIDKLDEYQRLGIPEYWLVDYWAIASRTLLGSPKLPTVFVHQLINGKYQAQAFRGAEQIISPSFAELQLTTEQIVAASQIYLL